MAALSTEALKTKIAEFFKGEIDDSDATLASHSRDASLFEIKPQLVVYPKDAADIENLVIFVEKNRKYGLSLTPRSAGTDMTGGPLNDSIIVDMTRHFNKIHSVGRGQAVVDPGVYYRDFEKATLEHELLLPCYTASRELCTVGGMVANNSGGEKTLTYGKTEDYIKELEVVLRDGKTYTVKPLTSTQLQKKLELKTVEGDLYRAIYKLVSKHKTVLEQAKPQVSKNSAGYYLWNVWDGKTFDLTKLIVGSQGTLGIVTKITFRLIKPKKRSRMLVIFLRELDLLADIVNHVLQHKPESFESYDDHTLKLAVQFFPEILKSIKAKSMTSLAFQFLPEVTMVLSVGMPKLILLAEFTGDSDHEAASKAQAAQASIEAFKLKTLVTKTKTEGKKYWVVRRESFNLLRHHIKGKHTAPFIDDIVVRPEKLPQFLPELNKVMAKYNLIYTIAGHVGDGNFHIIPLMDLADPKTRKIVPELSRAVYDLVLNYEGSISGEHNDGLIRTPYLRQMYGSKVYELFEEVKAIFDPHEIFNPNKKVGTTMRYALNHFLKDRKALDSVPNEHV